MRMCNYILQSLFFYLHFIYLRNLAANTQHCQLAVAKPWGLLTFARFDELVCDVSNLVHWVRVITVLFLYIHTEYEPYTL